MCITNTHTGPLSSHTNKQDWKYYSVIDRDTFVKHMIQEHSGASPAAAATPEAFVMQAEV